MMDRDTFIPTQNNVERNALFPTLTVAEYDTDVTVAPTTEEVVTRSINKAPVQPGYTWGHAEPLVHKMIDGFIEARDLYVTKFVDGRSDDNEHRLHLESYLRVGKNLIIDQVSSALRTNSLPSYQGSLVFEDEASLRFAAEQFTNDEFDATPERKKKEAAAAAQKLSRVAVSQTVEAPMQPAHVSYSDEDPSPETSHKFREIIRDLVPEQLQAHIDRALALGKTSLGSIFAISEPVQVITPQMSQQERNKKSAS